MGVARRIAAGTASGFLGHAINIAAQIVVVPLFLWAWGAEGYGEWLTVFAAVAYVSVLDFGMGMYVVNRLTESCAAGNRAEYRRVLGMAGEAESLTDTPRQGAPSLGADRKRRG